MLPGDSGVAVVSQLQLRDPAPAQVARRGLPHTLLRHRVQGGDPANMEDCVKQHQVWAVLRIIHRRRCIWHFSTEINGFVLILFQQEAIQFPVDNK